MPSPEITTIASDDTNMTSPEEGLRRQVMSYSPTMMLVRHTMRKGWVGVRHSHPHEQMVYIVRGRLVFEHPGGRFEVGTGESFLVPGDVPTKPQPSKTPKPSTSSHPTARNTPPVRSNEQHYPRHTRRTKFT